MLHIVSTMAARFLPVILIPTHLLTGSSLRSVMAGHGARWLWASAYGNPARGCQRRSPRVSKSPSLALDFHTFRDLALVGLMLLDGLRSCEVLALQLEDLQMAENADHGS